MGEDGEVPAVLGVECEWCFCPEWREARMATQGLTGREACLVCQAFQVATVRLLGIRGATRRGGAV